MLVKSPSTAYKLGDALPPIDAPWVAWPWGVTPRLMQWSAAQLKYPLGTVIHDVVDGHPVVAQIQTHYGYGAHPDWPQKAHKGTSVYALADDSRKAVKDPPEGWGLGSDSDDGFSGEGGDSSRDAQWALVAAGLALGALLGGPWGAAAGVAAGWGVSRALWR